MLTRLSLEELQHEAELHGYKLVDPDRIKTVCAEWTTPPYFLTNPRGRIKDEEEWQRNCMRREITLSLRDHGAFASSTITDRPGTPEDARVFHEEITIIMPEGEF